MLTIATGVVTKITNWGTDAQELTVDVEGKPRLALNYVAITGSVSVGERVLLNTTATTLRLGTGGYDFVIARVFVDSDATATCPSRAMGMAPEPELSSPLESVDGDTVAACPSKATGMEPESEPGHIMKARYLPCQLSVLTIEEQLEYAWVWERELEGMPVLVGQLHSQLIPVATGLAHAGLKNIVYIMTDGAALPMAFSHAARVAKSHSLIGATITCGQAFGGDYETVTLHSAMLAAKHILNADAVIVCQGPGNAGTGTRYGFSGIEQASILDAASALGGTPIAIVRISVADARERHQGISHHTLTSLNLVRSRCIVPLPPDTEASAIGERHDIRFIEGAETVVDTLSTLDLPLTTMGRTISEDRVFYLAAVAAGLAANPNNHHV